MDGLQFVRVPGTAGVPFDFGGGEPRVPIEVGDFFIGTTPVTQALWIRVMGATRTKAPVLTHPVTDVSWDDIHAPDGFLARLNAGGFLAESGIAAPNARFRLPSESEWEYAARGGPHWRDGYRYSGSNNPDDVAWYGHRWTAAHRFANRVLGPRLAWRVLRGQPGLPTRTHPVAAKKPNQLGIYDMSGNVWEWCEDTCNHDLAVVPRDGSPYRGQGDEKRLRGGCHHNWDGFCTVSWRYSLEPDFHDGCVGFRLAVGL